MLVSLTLYSAPLLYGFSSFPQKFAMASTEIMFASEQWKFLVGIKYPQDMVMQDQWINGYTFVSSSILFLLARVLAEMPL